MEACLYLGWLLFLAWQKPLMATLKALGLPYRVFLVMLVLSLLGGQLIDRGSATFPFVGWPLYTSPARGNPQYYDYTMVSESGREMPLELFRLSGSLSYRLMFPLKNMVYNVPKPCTVNRDASGAQRLRRDLLVQHAMRSLLDLQLPE